MKNLLVLVYPYVLMLPFIGFGVYGIREYFDLIFMLKTLGVIFMLKTLGVIFMAALFSWGVVTLTDRHSL